LQSLVQALEAAQMIVIVRHGNTFESGERPRRIGARTDLPLTAKGKEQAEALGAYFANAGIRFNRALTSPLIRARETAQSILARQEPSPELKTADFLREIDYGPDENQFEADVLARIGQPWLDAWEKEAKAPEGWIVEADQRKAAWRGLFSQKASGDGATLLVTSNGAARYALLSEPQLNQAAGDLASLKLPTGGFGILERDHDERWRLVEWGRRP